MADKVSKAQVGKAVDALIQYVGKHNEESTSLIEEEDFLYLVIALKKIPETRGKDKPIPIPLPHPLYSVDETEVCLFVKDHQGEGHKQSKNKVKAEKIPGIAKVIGISKLKTKYESHEKKRQLCNSYDLFMADDRILPSLPKLIGKTFFKKKKHPIPVKLSGKDWAGQVRKACGCTYLHLKGSSLTVRVAKVSQAEDVCVENVIQAIEGISKKVPAIKALYLKSLSSVALPIYESKE
jgi:ribosome biogenesis protein UTP30